MASMLTVYVAGNSTEDIEDAFLWDDGESAAIYADENGYKYVYEVNTIIDTDSAQVVYDLENAGE